MHRPLAAAGIDVRMIAQQSETRLAKLGVACGSLLASVAGSADVLITDMCTAGPLLAVWPAFVRERPVVIRLRADPWQTDDNERRRSRLSRLRPNGRRALRFFYERADALVPVSDFLAQRIRDETGIDGPKIETIREPIDLERFAPVADRAAIKEKLGLNYEHILCIAFNFHYEDKVRGLEHFLPVLHALVEKHRDVAVAIAGDGPLHGGFLRDNERWLKHPRLIATGFVAGVEQIYQCSDVCAHFSFFDAAPRALVEAWACGLPVIVNDHPALTENLRDNEIGCVIDGVSDEALEVFERVIYSPELRAKMGANARAFAEKHHRRDHIGEQYRRLFERLLARGS
ncbi:MAG: glycosyltransferase [candidate division WS1 bacterium]|nr:glycosyltransferase [candidate division WS1 bacterium]